MIRNTLLGCGLICSAVGLTVGAAPAPAQETEGQVQRLHGVIHENQTWSGRVVITDDLTIQEAIVTIAAGTVVEFAQKSPQQYPKLVVGASDSAGGHLELQGTADRPIIFRTVPNANPGSIVVNVRSRIVAPRKSGEAGGGLPEAARLPNDVNWQHVRFEDLGHIAPRLHEGQSARVPEPAIAFNLIGDAHTLSLVDCTFDRATRVEVRAGDGARITIVGNRFAQSKDRVDVEVFGGTGQTPLGPVAIARNTLTAALAVHAAPASIVDNLLVGPEAAIVVDDDDSLATRIAGNYVHNTTTEDEGRYCLNCQNPAAAIEENILRGGTNCVWNGSRKMSGNVLIAAPRLNSKLVKTAKTHQLVQALPAGAVFERNLLLGPAFSLLMPQPSPIARQPDKTPDPVIVRHNLFDGFSDSNRAIHLNPLGRGSVSVSVVNNVFLRMKTLVYDEARTDTALARADYNAVAPPAQRPFEQVEIRGAKLGSPGWSAKDVTAADVAGLRLTAPPAQPPPDFDADVLAGKVTVASLRQRLFNAYRPLPESPLVRAGDPTGAADPKTPPTIGPLEPSGR